MSESLPPPKAPNPFYVTSSAKKVNFFRGFQDHILDTALMARMAYPFLGNSILTFGTNNSLRCDLLRCRDRTFCSAHNIIANNGILRGKSGKIGIMPNKLSPINTCRFFLINCLNANVNCFFM